METIEFEFDFNPRLLVFCAVGYVVLMELRNMQLYRAAHNLEDTVIELEVQLSNVQTNTDRMRGDVEKIPGVVRDISAGIVSEVVGILDRYLKPLPGGPEIMPDAQTGHGRENVRVE